MNSFFQKCTFSFKTGLKQRSKSALFCPIQKSAKADGTNFANFYTPHNIENGPICAVSHSPVPLHRTPGRGLLRFLRRDGDPDATSKLLGPEVKDAVVFEVTAVKRSCQLMSLSCQVMSIADAIESHDCEDCGRPVPHRKGHAFYTFHSTLGPSCAAIIYLIICVLIVHQVFASSRGPPCSGWTGRSPSRTTAG